MLNEDLACKLEGTVGSEFVSDNEFVRRSYCMCSNILEVLDPTPPVVERALKKVKVVVLCR